MTECGDCGTCWCSGCFVQEFVRGLPQFECPRCLKAPSKLLVRGGGRAVEALVVPARSCWGLGPRVIKWLKEPWRVRRGGVALQMLAFPDDVGQPRVDRPVVFQTVLPGSLARFVGVFSGRESSGALATLLKWLNSRIFAIRAPRANVDCAVLDDFQAAADSDNRPLASVLRLLCTGSADRPDTNKLHRNVGARKECNAIQVAVDVLTKVGVCVRGWGGHPPDCAAGVYACQ